METWQLVFLFAPAPIILILTAVCVVFASARQAFHNEIEMERNRDLSESLVTLDKVQVLLFPVVSSCSLLFLFYVFSSVSYILTVFTAIASFFALHLCLSTCVNFVLSKLGLVDPIVSRCCSKSFTRTQAVLVLVCTGTVVSWLVSGHWALNNLLGVSICIQFVSYVRLPNIKVGALLLISSLVYDVFWVLFSDKVFGANVMFSVATKEALNPFHTLVKSLSLPGFHSIASKLELPVKIVIPRNLMGGVVPAGSNAPPEFVMLGLGDMALPGMILALVICFDQRMSRDPMNLQDPSSPKRRKYIWYALAGYAFGLAAAVAAGLLTRSPQPALLYLVPSTLGPVIFVSWRRNEFTELWEGTVQSSNDRNIHLAEV